MKKLNLSKELFFNSMLIGVLSLGLVSCGGGGGGGSVSTSQPSTTQPSTTQPSSSTSQPGVSTSHLSLSFSAYIYQGTNGINEPVITVYIDGQPVWLLADTGASGLVVNQTAVNIPSSDYTSYTFSSTYGDDFAVSGTMVASATVCLNPSITYTCVVMPVGVVSSTSPFPLAQGDIGLDSGLNIQDYGTNSSGSVFFGYSYATYLAQEYGISSYTISFYPLSNTFYEYASSTTPIGEITFSTSAPSTYLSYTGNLPSTTAVFPSYTSSTTSFTSPVTIFDAGSNYNFLSTDVFKTEIPNFSSSSDENNCLFGIGVLNGGFNIAYQIPYNFNMAYTTSFTTEPPTWFCSSNVQFNVMIGNTMDVGSYPILGVEIFGLPEMLRHTFVWVLNNQGLVQGISINP